MLYARRQVTPTFFGVACWLIAGLWQTSAPAAPSVSELDASIEPTIGPYPQTIRVGGRDTTVRQELKELNGPLEEAKADISGLWALQYLMNKGVIGLTSSHAKGMALQVNYLMDGGAVRINRDGQFSLDLPKTRKAVAALTHDIMTLQAHGDYAGVQKLMQRMIVIRPEVQQVIDRLTGVPVDIAPRFVTAEELTRQ